MVAPDNKITIKKTVKWELTSVILDLLSLTLGIFQRYLMTKQSDSNVSNASNVLE